MRRHRHTHTHYCPDATCPGFRGFPVTWAPDTETDPAYPLTDTCPHCGELMLDEEPNLSELEELLDALADERLIVTVPRADLDLRAMLKAIQNEAARQHRAARDRSHS